MTQQNERERLCAEIEENLRKFGKDGSHSRQLLTKALDALRSPVVEQQPRAWECRRCGNANNQSNTLCDACAFSPREDGIPLYAGVPGAQTISEAEAKQLRRDAAGLELALLRADEMGCVRLLGGEAQRILDFLKKQLSSNDGSGESDAE